MVELVQFGSVFRHNEREFVFLGAHEEIIYAARILDRETTNEVNKLYEAKVKNNSIEKVKSNALYCFVILETDDFKGRMAHFNETDSNEFEPTFDVIGTLNDKDLAEVKQEILAENSAVPLKLKEIVQQLDI